VDVGVAEVAQRVRALQFDRLVDRAVVIEIGKQVSGVAVGIEGVAEVAAGLVVFIEVVGGLAVGNVVVALLAAVGLRDALFVIVPAVARRRVRVKVDRVVGRIEVADEGRPGC
jgi:hypothetical protein